MKMRVAFYRKDVLMVPYEEILTALHGDTKP